MQSNQIIDHNDIVNRNKLSLITADHGYIMLARKTIESNVWRKPPLYLKVWLYFLFKAQHCNYKQMRRGQLFTSIPEIIEACSHYVGARKVAPTKDQIFQIIEWMRKPDERGVESNAKATMIATTKATHGMLITICKYDLYQDASAYESNNQSNDENGSKTLRKQWTPNNINKNDKNDNNEKKMHAIVFDEKNPDHYSTAKNLFVKYCDNPEHIDRLFGRFLNVAINAKPINNLENFIKTFIDSDFILKKIKKETIDSCVQTSDFI